MLNSLALSAVKRQWVSLTSGAYDPSGILRHSHPPLYPTGVFLSCLTNTCKETQTVLM